QVLKMNALTESKEDYLEAILVIGLEKKWVRVRDLAKYLGVKMSSVAAAVKSLAEKGLVSHEKYGYVELTENGVAIARQIYACHKTLYKFLHDLLGLSKAVASREACKIEHTLGAKTMKRLLKFIEFVEACPEKEPLWLSNFHYFIKTGERPEPCEKRDTNAKLN
ncbi:metal-dependent transcriptional regulator, partial [Candidatus Aerophobetes bacterium]|nr:metal-dependent transcriptional regulator [Candidatus Aerophobetes bacterium]